MSLPGDNQSRPYVILSAVLHIVIFVVLVTNVSFVTTEKMKQISTKEEGVNKEVIKAVAVKSEQVQQEIARLDKMEKEKQQQEVNKQKKLQEELAKIRKEKELEAQKLAEQKRQAQELKQQQDNLAQQNLKIKEELEKKQAEKIKLEEQAKKQEKQKAEAQAKADAQAKAAAQAKKENLKKQEQELLTKLKKEQEQKLLESLQEEDELIAEAGRRKAFVEKEIDRYIALQQAKVSRNWISRDSFLKQGLVTKLEIRLADDGRVISVNVVQASGNQALDISAKNAVMKASPLPLPADESLRSNFRVYRFTFRPDELT